VSDVQGKRILIIGATSAIAKETARIFAVRQAHLFLVGRDAAKLAVLAQDLQARGAASVGTLAVDLGDFSRHAEILDAAKTHLGAYDTVLMAHGVLGDQKAAEADYAVADEIFRVNFLSCVSLLTPIANEFEARRWGKIAVISSVAGDRGRQSNYVYGASKGALSVFLQGLRNRLAKAHVQVLTIKPGFVATPMTQHLNQGPLFVGPEVIAKGIVQALEKSKDVVYLPLFWLGIMTIVKAIPEFIFKKLKM